MRQNKDVLLARYDANPAENPVPHAAIQIGDWVEIRGVPDEGMPVQGMVVRYARLGDQYTVESDEGMHCVSGGRLVLTD